MATKERRATLYAAIWRWHRYAGLFVLPFVLILAVTGGIYLFKPQIEHFEERHFTALATAGAVAASRQAEAALAAFPGARFGNYRLPERPGDAAMLTLRLPGDGGTRQVFVAPEGEVLGSLDPKARVAEVAKKIHSQLLLGPRGSWLVELAASWAFVLMASGLYLWWPRGRRLAGVLWPRRGARGRLRWRDLHAVTAFWLFGLVAVLLLTSLPWTSVWGGAFQKLRVELGLVQGSPEWTLGGEPPAPALDPAALPLGGEAPADPHAGHHAGHHGGMKMPAEHVPDLVMLDAMVEKAKEAKLPFPVHVAPPAGLGRFGVPTDAVWTVFSDTQNRPRQRTLTFDAETAALLDDRSYDGGNPIDRVIGIGIAWHEGQLFGWPNQLAGVLTALGVLAIAASGLLMWRQRPLPPDGGQRLLPSGGKRAPPPARMGGALGILVVLAALLPLLALSLAVLLLFDLLLRPLLNRFMRRRHAT